MVAHENSEKPRFSRIPSNKKMDSRLVIPISRKLKISIYKPLIPLKIALALWYAASMGTTLYLTLYFKQRGLTVNEISFMYLAGYLIQCVFNITCGVVSDKIGRPLFLTVISIFIAGSLAFCMTFTPGVNEMTGGNQSLSVVYCSKMDYIPSKSNGTCDKAIEIIPCGQICTQECCEDVSLAHLNRKDKFVNNSCFSFHNPECSFSWCFRDSEIVLLANDTASICDAYHKVNTEAYADYKSAISRRNHRVLSLIATAILFFTFDENTYRFLDILANFMTNKFKTEYGKQIFWSNVGAMCGPSLVALIIQQTSTSDREPNYESSLYFYSTVAILTIATVCTLDISKGKPSQEMSRAALKLFKNVEFLLFVVILFILGGTWGFVMIFRNLILDEIKTPIYMMGLLDTFGGLCGLPVLFTGKWLTDKIGHTNAFCLALLGYLIKCFGYSFIRVAWPGLFLELFMAFSYHLLWVAVIDYSTKVGPENLKGSVVMLVGTVHYSLGRACGIFAGGLLMSAYGKATAFQIIGSINGIGIILYKLYHHLGRFRKIDRFDIS